MKLCKDCKYYREHELFPYWLDPICRRPIEPIGRSGKETCFRERMDDSKCGSEARFFTPTLWQQFKRLFT